MSNDWFYRYQTTILALVLVFVPIVTICCIFMAALSCSEFWSTRRGCTFSYFTCICGCRKWGRNKKKGPDAESAKSAEQADSSRTSSDSRIPAPERQQA